MKPPPRRLALLPALPLAALLALPPAALPPGAAAQQAEPRLPRVIHGHEPAGPRVLYGEPTPAPEARRPAAPAPQAAQPPRPAPPSGTTIFHGWLPVGPPRWDPWPGQHQLEQHPRWRPLPEPPPRDTRFESPLPMGTYLGRPPSATLPQAPAYGRQGR